MITQKEVRRLFKYNKKTGVLRWKVSLSNAAKIGRVAGSLHKEGYLITWANKKQYKTHRLIWLGVYGYLPEEVDHKDRIRHHNWIDNLRSATKSENQKNTKIRKDNKSGIKGVCWYKHIKKWTVQISIDTKQKTIGRFKDFDEAVCLRLSMEQCLGYNEWDNNSSAYEYVKENIQ